MLAAQTISPGQLPEVLLRVALARPVHLWGPPGIGKSSLVEQFAHQLGMDCVTLLGTQLAPEDLIGVPQLITGEDGVVRSRFAPPEMIARSEPYVLLLDELNAASVAVQKGFYSLILTGRLGTYQMPSGSIIIAAGNRGTDQASVKPMPAPLVNRFVHLHLRASAEDWLTWAANTELNPLVVEYLTHRPDHLFTEPPKIEEAFSTPRSWHALADALSSWGEATERDLALLAHGTISPSHAASFCAWFKSRSRAYDIEAIIKGDLGWPSDIADRDVLHFHALALRARLVKDLPESKRHASQKLSQFAVRAKSLLIELSDISLELAQLVVAGDDDGEAVLPTWFLTELVRDLPRLAAARSN